MRIWLGLLASPSIALACQAMLFALATPSCGMQSTLEMHAVALVSMVLTLMFTAAARSHWSAQGHCLAGADADQGDAETTQAFLAAAAAAVSALSTFTIFTMWVLVWILSPCAQ